MRTLSSSLALLVLVGCGGGKDDAAEGTAAGDCSDAADNDADGLFDCDDDGCAGSPDCEGSDVNAAPSGAAIAIEPAAPADTDDLRCVIVTEATDPNGDDVSYAYAWSKNGADADLTTDTVSEALTTGGDTWTCTVTPTDGTLDGAPASATVTIAQGNRAPSAPTVSISPAEPTDDDVLTCVIETESVDPDGDTVSYAYAWSVDGGDAGITGATVNAALTEVGQQWTCAVTASDGELESGAASVSVEVNSDDSAYVGECLPAYAVGSASGYATIAGSNGSSFDFGSSLTVAAWVRLPAGSLEYTSIFSNSSQDVDCPGMAMAVDSTGRVGYGSTNGTTYLYCAGDCDGAGTGAATSMLSREAWHHVAFVQDASAGIYVYVDGVLEGLDPCTLAIDVMHPVREMRVGRALGYSRGMSAVEISDLAFWSRAVSESEIETIASYAGAAADVAAGLEANIPFTEGAGTVARDTTGRHDVAIDESAATWTAEGPNCAQ